MLISSSENNIDLVWVEHKITENRRGKFITPEKVGSQVLAIIRDIRTERKGWWSQLKLVEEGDKVKTYRTEPKN